MKRRTVPVGKDHRVFNATASKVKAVNIPHILYRGGFRF